MNQPKDSLGDRMKGQYENRTRFMLPRRTYTIIRLDGKAFHTYTRGCERPFDLGLMGHMDETAKYLMSECQGAKLAFVQSDEINIVLTDFDAIQTSAWFDGNIQKMASVSASAATAKFNQLRPENGLAMFDSRVFTIPDPIEVENYMIWRQQDATRNSIQMAGQSMFSPKELHGVSTDALQELMWSQRGVNWNDYPEGFKRGRCIVREAYKVDAPLSPTDTCERSRWIAEAPPIFTKEREYIRSRITPQVEA
jgi:tRNA(His) guanylyltransferase